MEEVTDVVAEALAEGEAAALEALGGDGDDLGGGADLGDTSDDLGSDADAEAIVDREAPRATDHGADDAEEEGDDVEATAPTTSGWTSDVELPKGAKITFEKNGEKVTADIDLLIKHSRQLSKVQRIEQDLRRERAETLGKLEEAKGLQEKVEASDRILTEILSGNDQLLQRMRRRFSETGGGKAPAAAAGGAPAADLGPDDAAIMEAGNRVVQDFITPWAADLASAYGADANDLAEEIITMVGQEPNIDLDGLQDILERRIIVALEEAGYSLMGDAPTLDTSYLDKARNRPAAPAPGRRGLRPKETAAAGRGQKTAREIALEKQLAATKAQLQEKATGSAPGETAVKAAGTGSRRKGGPEPVKSELLDLTEDESVEDIMKKVRAL